MISIITIGRVGKCQLPDKGAWMELVTARIDTTWSALTSLVIVNLGKFGKLRWQRYLGSQGYEHFDPVLPFDSHLMTLSRSRNIPPSGSVERMPRGKTCEWWFCLASFVYNQTISEFRKIWLAHKSPIRMVVWRLFPHSCNVVILTPIPPSNYVVEQSCNSRKRQSKLFTIKRITFWKINYYRSS